jgi:hypothetical protein
MGGRGGPPGDEGQSLALRTVAIGALLPRFALLAAQETGRDGRFAEAVITVRDLPGATMEAGCSIAQGRNRE